MSTKNSPAQIREEILRLLSGKRRSISLKHLLRALNLPRNQRKLLARELEKMVQEGLLERTGRKSYSLPGRPGYITGTIQGHRRGFAFLRSESGEEFYINPRHLHGAVHRDQVVIRLTGGRGRRREGEVINILKRGQASLVGTLYQAGSRFYVLPDDRRVAAEILVSRRALGSARPGDKVVVEVQQWSRGRQPSRGRIVELIGPPGTPATEEKLFRYKHNLPGDFPEAVKQALELLPGEEEIEAIALAEQRRDLRQMPLVTIDDEQARDFDDAVSLELLDGGGYRLGVHIADVSHYVRRGSALDRESLDRGTSVYLPDQVIHMLPPLLSEKLCSLQAGRDRLALSVLMDLSPAGELFHYEIFPSLIRVRERLSYRQVEAQLEGRGEEYPLAHPELAPMLEQMDLLAAELRRRRLERGALDLDIPEARIELDQEGRPVSVERRLQGRSESLIEEFMLLCNEVVASCCTEAGLPLIYRVHSVPQEEKLASLQQILALLDRELVGDMQPLLPRHLKKLLERSRGHSAEPLVRYLILRSLPQARYSAQNEGHFGLASSCYCHFTAPIRRYPDLEVHRILKEYLAQGELTPRRRAFLEKRLPLVAEHASERERAAMEAEREAADRKKAEYMESKLGEVFPGLVSGVTNFGLFVELENTVEGMVPLSDLEDDYYVYHEKLAALIGERTRRTYRLGDAVWVQVVRVNPAEGNITFALVEQES